MKKAFIPFIVILFVFAGCRSQSEVYLFTSFREPATDGLYLAWSEDGYHWDDLGGPFLAPMVGTQKVMRDPSVVKGPDGTYHMVWTSSWKGDLGFGYASTKDFISWSEQKHLPVMAHDTSTVNVWAPEIFYDDESKDFIITWASTIPFKFEKGIEEERNNHRMYYVTTKDFITFSETKLYLDPGFSVIDCVIVKRGKGDYVLVLKDNTRPNRNLKVAFGKTPLGPWENISKPFTGFLTEGPTVIKPAGKYLIYYDFYGEKKYAAAETEDFISFADATSEILLPQGHKHGTITRVKHGVIEKIKKGKVIGH